MSLRSKGRCHEAAVVALAGGRGGGVLLGGPPHITVGWPLRALVGCPRQVALGCPTTVMLPCPPAVMLGPHPGICRHTGAGRSDHADNKRGGRDARVKPEHD